MGPTIVVWSQTSKKESPAGIRNAWKVCTSWVQRISKALIFTNFGLTAVSNIDGSNGRLSFFRKPSVVLTIF